jgi:hypothetical protein
MVVCGEGALVLAFSLSKPCKEGKGRMYVFLFNFKQLNTIILLILIYSIQLPIDYNYLE